MKGGLMCTGIWMHGNRWARRLASALVALVCVAVLLAGTSPALSQADNPNPPPQVVKLIFIHHSTGENWLADDNGGLGLALGNNRYFVSDTNYGWGPDAIGDRTDIPNWLEWFRSDGSPRYLQALYSESGQNSAYTSSLPDPGGENTVILFKSCFPNSNLEGSPGDPPAPGEGLSVSNAKYVYNQLLQYFITRPDKLFVVITAPPVQDGTYAANARAFNTWLLRDWLRENNYPYANVAVWDFYNVLTGSGNHHRFSGGAVEYINDQGGDTSFYPSDGGDDHPSRAGNLKATEEFLPMLNLFYNRWKAAAPAGPAAATPLPLQPTPEVQATPLPESAAPPALPAGVIDDFEGGAPAGTEGWQAYWDEATSTAIQCGPDASGAHGGRQSLLVNFNVAPNSWATCALMYQQLQDWRSLTGLSFFVHAPRPGLVFDINVYRGASEDRQTYLFTLETVQADVDGWRQVSLTWDQFLRADWEADPGTPLDAVQVQGLSVGFNTFPDTPNTGAVWVDDLQFTGAQAAQPAAPTPALAAPTEPASPPEAVEPATEAPAPAETEPASEPGSQPRTRRLCPGSMAAAAVALAAVVWATRRRRSA